jgi:hypothetical protein
MSHNWNNMNVLSLSKEKENINLNENLNKENIKNEKLNKENIKNENLNINENNTRYAHYISFEDEEKIFNGEY